MGKVNMPSGKDVAINELNWWCRQEFGRPATFSDIGEVGVAYSTAYDANNREYEMQWYADFEQRPRLYLIIDGAYADEVDFANYHEMAMFISNYMTFDGLVSATEDFLAGEEMVL